MKRPINFDRLIATDGATHSHRCMENIERHRSSTTSLYRRVDRKVNSHGALRSPFSIRETPKAGKLPLIQIVFNNLNSNTAERYSWYDDMLTESSETATPGLGELQAGGR